MTRRITLAIAAALAALLLSAGLAAAQDPPETATATRLEPGLNLVGWVGEPTPVSQLFQQIPQLEAIWAWDAELHDWTVAAPNAPEWLGGLGRVTAGMGLRMQLGGDQPYLWQRSTEPTRGLVKLRTGWNLVAWSGADGAAIGDVVKGIGWSLRTVRRWDAANQQWVTWTSPERSAQVIANTDADQDTGNDDEMPGIRRGEALWIEVARAVNWLQPTDILPRLVFPGGASQELQARVREDLQATLAFFRDRHGIQADPDFTVYAAKDVDALIQAWRDDGVHDTRGVWTRAAWNSIAGWVARPDIVVKQSSHPTILPTSEIAQGRYIITHEYFHIIQDQLSDDGGASVWLGEGMASWVDDQHKVLDGEQTSSNLRNRLLSTITNDTPTLRSAEISNAVWEYTLGWLATDQLTSDNGPDSAIEFWRQLAPTEVGPYGRWISTPDWRTVFQGMFGLPVSEFYTDFDAWQREQAAANPTTANSYDGNWIRGRVTREDGGPVAGVFLTAIRVESGTDAGSWNQRAETGDDGSFAVRAPEAGDYHLSVNINDSCRRYYSDGRLIEGGDPVPIKVSQSDVSVNIRLPLNVCVWQIRGRVLDTSAEPLAGISVTACTTGRGQCRSSTSAADGSFAVTVDESGEYRISAYLGRGCHVYFRSGVPATNWGDAPPITVAQAHVGGILMRVPKGACAYSIVGSTTKSDGQPLANTSIWACSEDDDHCTLPERTDAEGMFAITVPTEGSYRVAFDLNDCRIYFRADDLTTVYSERFTVRVEGRDVRLNHRQIPADMCAHRISGRLVDSRAAPLPRNWISTITGSSVVSGGSTDWDGHFEIRVPSDGAYAFRIRIIRRNQPTCFHTLAGQSLGSPDNPVRISGADVTSIVLRLPATIEELCE